MLEKKQAYIDNLYALREVFGTKNSVSLIEAAAYCCVDQRTLLKNKELPVKFLGKKGIISIPSLANWLSHR